jgi:hypothetical protein
MDPATEQTMHAGAGPRVSFAAAEGASYRAQRDVSRATPGTEPGKLGGVTADFADWLPS